MHGLSTPADRAAWIRLVGVAVAAILLLCALVLAWQGARAAILLSRASDHSQLLLAQVAQGDVDGARRTASALAEASRDARRSTDGPLWAAASWLPVLGDDVRAMRVVAREVDRVASGAVPTAVEIADQVSLDAFSPDDGRIDVANLTEVAPRLAQPRRVLEKAAREVDQIEPEDLVGRLRAPVERLQDVLDGAASGARIADTAAQILPDMLGGDGKRRYLLIIQNNAEVRSLGGIPGSFAVIEADRGSIRMRRQGSGLDVPLASRPVVPIPASERGALPPAVAMDLRDTTTDPSFPRAARYAGTLVARALDTRFDGVVSVDPVALGLLLEGIGPVRLDDGTRLTAANAVDELLNGVYRRYPDDRDAQDDVFKDAARRIFDAFVVGDAPTQPVLEALVSSGIDRRILVWSADAQEQRRLESSGISGKLVQSRKTTQVGVYLSDAASTKLQYYLRATHRLRSVRCVDGDSQSLVLNTTLRSDVPQEVASLPDSITGDPAGSVRRGDQRLNVRVVAPAGAVIESVRAGDVDRQPVGGMLGSRRVTVVPVTIAPGGSLRLDVRMRTMAGQVGDPVLSYTPGVAPGGRTVRVTSACR